MLERVSCTHTWKANSTKNHGSQSAPNQQIPPKGGMCSHFAWSRQSPTEQNPPLIKHIKNRIIKTTYKTLLLFFTPQHFSRVPTTQSTTQNSKSPAIQHVLTFKADVNTLGGILWSYYYEIKYTQTLLVGRQTPKWQLQHSVCLKQQARQKEIIH